MPKMTEEEREALIKKAEFARDNAPVMPEADARRLHEKWRRDSNSFNASMITSPSDKGDK